MRAGLFLEALSADHDVHLLVVPVALGAADGGAPEFTERHASRITVLDPADALDPLFSLLMRIEDRAARSRMLRTYPRPLLARFTHPRAIAEAADRFEGIDFALVHVMRTYLAGFATPWLRPHAAAEGSICVLDADECESRTHRSLAALHMLRGESGAAERESEEAAKYERIEAEELPRFDRILVASPEDATALRSGARVRVVPNGVQVPRDALRAADSRIGDPFTFLFVGTLDYLPNVDGCVHFCREILPHIREQHAVDIRVVVVGRHPVGVVSALDGRDGVSVIGDVPDVGPYYAAADAAVIPLRAGGGTRIKLLEAFAHGVPVVATRVGAEGLVVVDGEHALIADDASTFAAACGRLMRDPALRASLRRRAYDWVLLNHDREVVVAAARRAIIAG